MFARMKAWFGNKFKRNKQAKQDEILNGPSTNDEGVVKTGKGLLFGKKTYRDESQDVSLEVKGSYMVIDEKGTNHTDRGVIDFWGSRTL